MTHSSLLKTRPAMGLAAFLTTFAVLATACTQSTENDTDSTAEAPPAVQTPESLPPETPQEQTVETQTEATPESPALTGEETWQELWTNARLGELLVRRGEFPADPLLSETLVLAALFANNLPLAEELAQNLPEVSPVNAYFAAFKDLLGPLEDPDVIREKLDALGAALDAWDTSDPHRALLKSNAEGFALAAMGRRSIAFTKYSDTLQQWPENGVAIRNLANMYRAAGMHKFSASAFQRLVNVHGNVGELRRLLFEAFERAQMERDAIAFAEATFALNPRDPDVIANLARLYLQSGNVNAAMNVLQSAVRALPDDQALKLLLARAQVRIGQPAQALETLEQTFVPEALQTAAVEIRAFAHAQLDQWEDVLAAFEDVPAEAVISLGMKLLKTSAVARQGNLEAARAALQIDSGPEQVHPILRLANRALGGSSDGVAPPDQELAEALNSDSAQAIQFAYAMAARHATFYRLAFQELQVLNEAMPNQPRLISYTFDTLSRAKSVENRMAVAETIAENNESVPDTWVGLASVYRDEGHTRGEREVLQRALRLAPDRMDIVNQVAQFAIRVQDDPLAMDMYNRLITLDPENPTILNNHAYYLLETGGDLQLAEQNARRSLDALPNNANVMHTLGVALLRQGKLDEAEPHLERALQLRPGDPTLTLDYGKLLIERGQREEGRRFIQIAVLFTRQLGLDFPRMNEALDILGLEPTDPSITPRTA